MDIIQVAERVLDACVRAAAEAYEDAGVQGLCAEGRWEATLGALRALEVQAVVAELRASPDARRA